MKYRSTRGSTAESFSEAFNKGLADDGGLFVPEIFPGITEKLAYYSELSYPQLAAEFLSLFADEIPKEEWIDIAERAYADFDSPEKIKLKDLKGGELSILELFHGPTLAFKDFALQIVGKLYERECLKNGKSYTILGATSGDTGSAAIYGVLNNPRVNIFIMYPYGKIAPEQELQITTTGSLNVFPIAINGTFDDAQAVVKAAFTDKTFSEQTHLAAVNSINVARILAQSVYYLYAYLKIKKEQGDEGVNKKIRFIVPTGNFGNVMSGWILNYMGIECDFVLATNENDVLHQLWETGEYKKKDARVTHAPSMDIQQASNFERLLYFMYDKDTEKVKETLSDFKNKGQATIDTSLLPKSISSVASSNAEIEGSISSFYKEYGYLLDPHTACACKAVAGGSHDVILATASPAKFPEIVQKCTGILPTDQRLENLKGREKIFERMDAAEGTIKDYIKNTLAALSTFGAD